MPRIKSIKAEIGLSLEKKGTWYKFYYGMEIEPLEGEDIAELKEKLWNTAYDEIEKQINEIGK